MMIRGISPIAVIIKLAVKFKNAEK